MHIHFFFCITCLGEKMQVHKVPQSFTPSLSKFFHCVTSSYSCLVGRQVCDTAPAPLLLRGETKNAGSQTYLPVGRVSLSFSLRLSKYETFNSIQCIYYIHSLRNQLYLFNPRYNFWTDIFYFYINYLFPFNFNIPS